jgi:hypothetical protein
MTQIRYFVHFLDGGWSVRRDSRAIGAFRAEAEATAAAAQHAAIDRVRGHDVQVLKLGEDGRWSPCSRSRTS